MRTTLNCDNHSDIDIIISYSGKIYDDKSSGLFIYVRYILLLVIKPNSVRIMEQLSLFNEEKNNIDLPADLIYIKNFIQEEESQSLLQKFIGDLPWQQTERILYGKKIITPRLTVWLGDPRANYSVSGKPAFPINQLTTIPSTCN